MRKQAFVFLFALFTAAAPAQQVTYINNVAPIIQSKCASCHKPGEAAPFSLLTYEEVAKRAGFIKNVVQSGYMPPWKADDHYVSFANNRSLSEQEIRTIADWVKGGAVKGNGKEQAPVETEGSSYGRKPDLTLKIEKPYLLPGDNKERFIIFKIPFELADSANVEAIEFYTNNKKIVHHANYAIHEVPDGIDIQNTPAVLNLTDDDKSKYEQYRPYRKTITYYGGWIPGSSYESYPEGIGWIMPKRGVILLTAHYGPLGKQEESICGVNLFFKKTAIRRKVKIISFGSGGIGEKDITPPFNYLEPNKVSSYKLKVFNQGEDASVMFVWPHMHLVGKSIKGYALLPGGDTLRLVNIPEWDFRWQELYRLKRPVKLPHGATVVMEGTYDNTDKNPFNPNQPPNYIMTTGEMKSNEEMFTMILIYVPYQPGDEARDW